MRRLGGRRPSALRHRNFRLFLIGQGISVVGTWMQNLGQAWIVLLLTNDPFFLGLTFAAQGIPIVALALVGGAIADRVSKRAILLVTQSTMLVLGVVLGLLCLTASVSVWHVIAFAFALGCVSAIDMPTRQAFVLEMVGADDVASAVGLNSTVYNTGRLVGPAAAGLIIAAATSLLGRAIEGTGVAFLLNGLSYGGVVVGVLLIRERELFALDRSTTDRTLGGIAAEVRDGLRYLRDARSVLLLLAMPGLIAAVAVNFNVYVPVLAREFGLDAGGLGLLMAASGLGALGAALRIGVGGRAGVGVVFVGAAVLGVAEVLTGLLGSVLLSVALLFAAGAGATAMRVSANTSIQLATPPHLRGRVMSVFAIVFEGASPIGGLLAGGLAAAAGGRTALIVAGLTAAILALIGSRVVERVHGEAVTAPGSAVP
jgi:MFS family permease